VRTSNVLTFVRTVAALLQSWHSTRSSARLNVRLRSLLMQWTTPTSLPFRSMQGAVSVVRATPGSGGPSMSALNMLLAICCKSKWQVYSLHSCRVWPQYLFAIDKFACLGYVANQAPARRKRRACSPWGNDHTFEGFYAQVVAITGSCTLGPYSNLKWLIQYTNRRNQNAQ